MEKKSQCEKLYDLLSDGEAHSTNEIIEKVYPNEGRIKTPARISARAWDVKHKYGVNIESNPDEFIRGMWWYRITPPDAKFAPISDLKEKNDITPVQDTLFVLESIKPRINFD